MVMVLLSYLLMYGIWLTDKQSHNQNKQNYLDQWVTKLSQVMGLSLHAKGVQGALLI